MRSSLYVPALLVVAQVEHNKAVYIYIYILQDDYILQRYIDIYIHVYIDSIYLKYGLLFCIYGEDDSQQNT